MFLDASEARQLALNLMFGWRICPSKFGWKLCISAFSSVVYFPLHQPLNCMYCWPYMNTSWFMSLFYIYIYFFSFFLFSLLLYECLSLFWCCVIFTRYHSTCCIQCLILLFGSLYTIVMIIHYFLSCKMYWAFSVLFEVPNVISASESCIEFLF